MFLNENTDNSYLEGVNEFEGKYTGEFEEAFEICLESEREWHNLEMKMTRAEHTAIVNEDTALMEGAVGDFFAKAKQWFITLGKKIKEFFKRLIERIGVFFMNAKKFVAKYGKQLEKLGNNEIKGTIKMYPSIVKNSIDLGALDSLGSDELKEIETKAYSVEEIREELKIPSTSEMAEIILGGEKSEETITSSIVKTALGILRDEAVIKKELAQINSDAEKEIKKGIKECEAALKGNISDPERSKLNRVVSNSKNCASLVNTVLGQLGGLYSKLASNSLSICKKAWTSRKGENIKQKGYEESVLDMF